MSGLCKDCRFWDAEYVKDFVKPQGWGSCELADLDAYPDALMDVENRPGWLKTAPNFGCVEFEAKDG